MIFLRINLPNFVQFKQYQGNSENIMLCYDPLESRVGGPKVHGDPNLLIVGCALPRPPAPSLMR